YRHGDVEGVEALVARALLEAAPEVLLDERGVVGVERGEQEAVAELTGLLLRLLAERAHVDGDVGVAVEDALERLALPRRARAVVRDAVLLAVVHERFLALEDLADDLHVLAHPRERLVEGLPVPALDDLRARGAEAEDEAAAGERVERHRRHGGV